jgi:hypothetical protein
MWIDVCFDKRRIKDIERRISHQASSWLLDEGFRGDVRFVVVGVIYE